MRDVRSPACIAGVSPKFAALSMTMKSVRESTSALVRSLGYAARTFPSAEDFLRSDWNDTRCLILASNHPDKMIARGVSSEFVNIATENIAAINAAYDAVARERRTRMSASRI